MLNVAFGGLAEIHDTPSAAPRAARIGLVAAGQVSTPDPSWPHRLDEGTRIYAAVASKFVSEVRMARSTDYGLFSLNKPWNAACRKDGENGRLHKTLSSVSCLESVRNSGTADGCRSL